jgi:hypothetical protein
MIASGASLAHRRRNARPRGGAKPPCGIGIREHPRFHIIGDTLVIVGRLLIVAGLVLIALGVAVTLLSKTSMPLGRLPGGDIVWRGKNTTFYFPVVTCILLSIAGTLLLWLFSRK